MSRRTVVSALAGGALCLLAATLAGYAGGYWWFFELFVHFRPHYTLAGAVLVLASLALRAWRAFAISLLCLALNAAAVLPFLSQPRSVATAGDGVLRIASANIGGSAFDNSEAIIGFIDTQRPDVLLLIELTPAKLARLQPTLDDAYPHAFSVPRDDYFGIGLFSRYPLTDRRLLDLGYRDVPVLSARLETARAALRIVGVHLEWPMTAAASRGRNTQIVNLPDRLRGIDEPIVLLGDFNLTRWAARYPALLDATGLRDAAAGIGWQPTWPAWLPGLGIAIDHCLVSPSLGVVSHRTGPAIGSDHLPLLVELRTEPAARRGH